MPTLRILLLLAFQFSLLAQTSVLTQHNDIGRTGQNLTESILTPQNVSGGGFGKLYSIPLDGQAYAQPLYVSNLQIGGVSHSALFVATEHDSVYAFDVNSSGAPLWKASLLDAAHGAAAGAITEPEADTGCSDFSPENGITGTPVVDGATGTLYVVSLTYEANYPVQRLHALDITSGAEKFGGPIVIQATVAGTGNGTSGGIVSFDPKWQNQRAGLLLVNGAVYIGWASHCDLGPWHGWVMSYSAANGKLQQTGAFITTPNGDGGGIWMSGAGLAADNIGGHARMFVPTGNGTFDAQGDRSETVLNLNLAKGMAVADTFTPYNQAFLTQQDADLASGGLVVLPDQPGPHTHLAVIIGKAAELYLLNRENLGGNSASTDNVVQEIDAGFAGGVWAMPGYFNGNVYYWPSQGSLLQYSLTNGVLSSSPVAMGGQTEAYNQNYYFGSSPSISANGNSNGIVWVDDWVASVGTPTQKFYAYDASDVSKLLWSSTANATRDGAGLAQKFAFPTIADGKVFLAAQNQMQVYGLLYLASQSITFNSVATQTAGTTLTLSATATSGLPVTFSSTTGSVCGISGGTATFLASGTCTITASQAGSSSYYAATPVTQSFQVTQPVSSGPPTVVSITPSSGSFTTQTFVGVYSDPAGGSALTAVYILFNKSVTAANGCYVLYYPSSNLLYLKNDAGTANSAGITPGTTAKVSNSLCSLSAAGSSYAVNQKTGTLSLALTFNGTASENSYLLAADTNGNNSGWVQKGTLGAAAASGPPTAVSVTPSGGSGAKQTFAGVYSDPNGGANLTAVYMLFNSSVTAGNGCYVLYYPSSNLMYLKNTAGTANSIGVTPGSTGQVSNSFCTLSGAGSSYNVSGSTGTLNLALTFNGVAATNIYLFAADTNGSNSGWIQKGTWSAAAATTGVPSAVWVTPNSGSGASQTFTGVYSDPNGAAALNWVSLLFNSSISSAHGCYVSYDPGTNLLYLMNDAGSGFAGTVAMGSAGQVSNSQCTVSAAGASYRTYMNGATFAVPVTFSGAWQLGVYLYASESNGSNSGWVQEGIWTP